jgi:hypothetical protein
MEYIWSAYEVIGEIMMNRGATKPAIKDKRPMSPESGWRGW